MKAVVVTRFGPNPAPCLQLQDIPVPTPQPHEVLIRVCAVGVNYADLMQRRGLYPGGPKPPYVAGMEFAGIVEKVAAVGSPHRVGDRVMGLASRSYAEFCVAEPAALFPLPAGVSMVDAAALPCQYLTAYHALHTLGRVRPGQTVLVQAGAGGLGSMLVQLAHIAGMTVLATASSDEKCEFLRGLGCDHPMNYARVPFAPEVLRITQGKGCDLVLDSVGGDVFEQSLLCVRPRGHLIVLGMASGKLRSVAALDLLFKSLTVSGLHLFSYLEETEAQAAAQASLHVWLQSGRLRPLVRHTFSLEQAAEAHQLIADRKTTGKVVLTVATTGAG